MKALWGVALPIGISFFTFQAMSYVFDVYREKVPVQGSLSDFALYVSLFPQLIAGPIVQYGDIAEQLKSRSESLSLFSSGRWCVKRRDFRLFKLNRMDQVKISVQEFPPKQVPMPDLSDERVFPGGIKVKVLFEQDCKWRLIL